MRNNDFSPEAAIAEAIDNSLDAQSKNIKIKIFRHTPPGKRKPRPQMIVFGDDGIGMDQDTIQYALKIGWSSRYNQRNGIGRFGVGMTYGAISVCEFIEIYSRQKGGNWLYTNLDIEDRSDNQDPGIEKVKEQKPPKEFLPLVGDVGTLVIWRNIDRIGADFDIANLNHWLGRTYRKFIGNELLKNKKIEKNTNVRHIFLEYEDDGILQSQLTEIKAFDPMYIIPDQFHVLPENETAEIIGDQTFNYNVHEVDAPPDGTKEGNINLRYSLTPKSWRLVKQHSGRSAENNKRWIWDNEGISFLRAGREIAYKRVLELGNMRDTHDRFWSCEIDFSPTLDHQFSVRNIKVGARPLLELKRKLEGELRPKIKRLKVEHIEKDWRTEDIKKHGGDGESSDRHRGSESTIDHVSKPKQTGQYDEEKKNTEQYTKDKNLDEQSKIAFLEKLLDPKGPSFVIDEDENGRPDGPFIDIVPDLTKKLISYNLRHAFFTNLFDKLHEIDEMGKSTDPQNERLTDIVNSLKDDIDYLLYAFADSKLDIEKDRGNVSENVSDTLNDLEMAWSDKLRRVYRKKNE